MGVSVELRSGDQAQEASPAAIPCLIGCSSSAWGGVYTLDAGQDVSSVIGDGTLSDVAYAYLRTPGIGRVVVSLAAPTWSPAPAVVQTGDGPTIALALADGASGCADDHGLVITVQRGGANGVATLAISYDGGVSETDVVPVPVERTATLRGSANLGSSVPAMNARTLVFTEPVDATITFASSPTTAAGIAAAFNVLAEAEPIDVRARVAETTAGSYFELYALASGVSAGFELSGSSTALGVLGLSATSVLGAAATLTLPHTGLVATCDAGTYVAGTIYTATCTGPRPSLAAESTALDRAVEAIDENPFGFVVFVHPSTSASQCAARQGAHSASLAAAMASTSNPIALSCCVGGPLHAIDPDRAGNDTAIAAVDAEVLEAFSGSSPALDSVALGGVWVTGSSSLRSGLFRRSAAVAWGIQRASAARLADDVGSRALASGTLLVRAGADTLRERNEHTARVKLGGGGGAGFSVLAAYGGDPRVPRFEPGATRAGPTSRLRYSGVVAVGKEIARLAVPVVMDWRGQSYATNPETGQLADHSREQLREALALALRTTLMTGESYDRPYNASAYTITIKDPTTGTFQDNGQIPVEIAFVPLGEVESVAVTISAVGTIGVS